MKNTNYLIIGNGRLAKHLRHYFSLLNIPNRQWTRQEGQSELYDRAAVATHLLLCISDSVLQEFYQTHLTHLQGTIIHFSGALDIPGTHSVHPLMTFGQDLYDLDFYKKIPMVSSSKKSFSELLPGLPNPSYHIQPEQKPYYHSLCVIGGNLTSLLVSKMQSGMKELGLPADVSQMYIQKSIENVFQNPQGFFTGPLARKDQLTVEKNLAALKNDPFQQVYRSFIPMTFPEFIEKEGSHENPRV